MRFGASKRAEICRGRSPLNFHPLPRGAFFSTPCAIWGPQQPPAAQRNRPFFSSGAPAGHGGRQGGAPPVYGCAPHHSPRCTCLGPSLPSPGILAAKNFFGPHSLNTWARVDNEARTEEAPVRRLKKEEKEVPPRPPDRIVVPCAESCMMHAHFAYCNRRCLVVSQRTRRSCAGDTKAGTRVLSGRICRRCFQLSRRSVRT
jgi:hypothetical protein